MPDAKPNSKHQTNERPKRDFASCLKLSQLHSPEVVSDWLQKHDSCDDMRLASQLVRDGHLTKWQAKYLLSGRYRLHLGNYRLLERIHRDEFGDRFVAVHPNLGRQVLIQVLPMELTAAADQREAFLANAGKVGELDHPNLLHVYDIDHDQGRYFLVTEHVAGESLANLADKSFTPAAVGRIVRDAIAGLQHAHANGLAHGRMTQQSVLITDSGTAKITQLALAPLANQATDEPLADLVAVVNEIGPALASRTAHIEEREELTALLANLRGSLASASDFDVAFSTLSSWVDATSNPTAAAPIPASPPRGQQESNWAELQEPLGQPKRNQAERPSATANADEENRFLPTSWLLAGVAAVSLLLGGLGVAGFSWVNRSSDPSSLTLNRTNSAARSVSASASNQMQDTGSGKLSRIEWSEFPGKKPSAAPGVDGFPSTGSLEDSSPENASPTKPKTKTTLPTRQRIAKQRGNEPISAVTRVAPNPKPNTPRPPTAKAQPKRPAAKTANRKRGPAATKIEGTSESKAAGKKPAAEPHEQNKKEEEATGPFDRLAETVDLPNTESLDAVELGKIKTGSTYLLGLELIAPAGIASGKTTFVATRAPKNKQRWNLEVKRNPRAKGKTIGKFQFDWETERLDFQWTEDAARSKFANNIRNAGLKLTVASESRTIGLRKPLKLEPLTLSAKTLAGRADCMIDHLPNPEMITVELLPWKAAGMPETWIEPAIVPVGQSAVVHFHEAVSNRFCFLQINTNMRKKVSLETQLVLKHAEGTLAPVRSQAELKQLAASVRQAAAEYAQEYNAKKDLQAPKGKITAFKEYVAKVKSNMTKAQKQTTIAQQNIEILSTVYDRAIPAQIIFRSGDHRVVLADTTLK